MLGVCRYVMLVSLAQKLKSATSRGPSGHESSRKSSGNWWNSRSTSRKTTGSCVLSIWSRRKSGLSAIIRKRNSSEPSGAEAPMKSEPTMVALQHTPFRLHDPSRRRAFTSYAGENSDTPTNSICDDLHQTLIRIRFGWSKAHCVSLSTSFASLAA